MCMRLTLFFATVLLAGQVGGQSPQRVTIPAGTRLLIRTSNNIDSRSSRPGSRFTGTLETNRQQDAVTEAPRGTTVHGRLIQARSAGRTSGRSNLTLELTDIVINGTANPILTKSYEIRGRGQGGRKIGRAHV